jgi:hypothetical protein
MTVKKRPALALVVAALALTASGYAATGRVNGVRSSDRASSPGNGHCGHSGDTPPCNGHGLTNRRSGRGSS